jgi:predicted methyltransferase MtxX (methanogen marker protein 4)
LIELFKQYGYDVRHEQQLFAAPLDDGRQIVVPVDGYQITPVSRRY